MTLTLPIQPGRFYFRRNAALAYVRGAAMGEPEPLNSTLYAEPGPSVYVDLGYHAPDEHRPRDRALDLVQDAVLNLPIMPHSHYVRRDGTAVTTATAEASGFIECRTPAGGTYYVDSGTGEVTNKNAHHGPDPRDIVAEPFRVAPSAPWATPPLPAPPALPPFPAPPPPAPPPLPAPPALPPLPSPPPFPPAPPPAPVRPLGHPHAESMVKYAQDALKHSEPWERWEVSGAALGPWRALRSHPDWLHNNCYRRKPHTITIGKQTLVGPLREEPEDGAYVYMILFSNDSLTLQVKYSLLHRSVFERGVLFSDEASARAAALAIMALLTHGLPY